MVHSFFNGKKQQNNSGAITNKFLQDPKPNSHFQKAVIIQYFTADKTQMDLVMVRLSLFAKKSLKAT